MSVKIMAWCWDHAGVAETELLMLLAIADHANDEGICWPSVATLARKARVHERQARTIIRRLEARGLIEVELGNGRGRTSFYRIKGAVENPFSPTKGAVENPFSAKGKGAIRREKGQCSARKGAVRSHACVEPTTEPTTTTNNEKATTTTTARERSGTAEDERAKGSGTAHGGLDEGGMEGRAAGVDAGHDAGGDSGEGGTEVDARAGVSAAEALRGELAIVGGVLAERGRAVPETELRLRCAPLIAAHGVRAVLDALRIACAKEAADIFAYANRCLENGLKGGGAPARASVAEAQGYVRAMVEREVTEEEAMERRMERFPDPRVAKNWRIFGRFEGRVFVITTTDAKYRGKPGEKGFLRKVLLIGLEFLQIEHRFSEESLAVFGDLVEPAASVTNGREEARREEATGEEADEKGRRNHASGPLVGLHVAMAVGD